MSFGGRVFECGLEIWFEDSSGECEKLDDIDSDREIWEEPANDFSENRFVLIEGSVDRSGNGLGDGV